MTEAATARTTQADGHPVQRKDLTGPLYSPLPLLSIVASLSNRSQPMVCPNSARCSLRLSRPVRPLHLCHSIVPIRSRPDASARLFHDSDYSDAPAAWEAEYLDDLTDAAEVGAIYTINGNEAVVLVFPAGTSQTDATCTGTKMNRDLARSEAQHRFRYEVYMYLATGAPRLTPSKAGEATGASLRRDGRPSY